MVTKTQMKKVLLQSIMEPNKPGPEKFFFDKIDTNYCELRVLELISDAIAARKQVKLEEYHGHMKKAISLLAIARMQNSER